MDSMRNLSTSLPPSGRRRTEPPQELLTEFKAAALSVTNLYKTAASAQSKARSTGYQDALDDLLTFLDRENLGLMDGEGWRVRQWATERLDDGVQRQAPGSDDDEDAGREDGAEEVRAASPETMKTPSLPASSSGLKEESLQHRRIVSEPPQQLQQAFPSAPPAEMTRVEEFTFRSNHVCPSNHDRQGSMDVDNSAPATPSSTDTVRIISRPARNRHSNRQRDRRTSAINLNLGAGAGSKRKIPYPDFFDISGIWDGQDRKDGGDGRGGKRGRHV